MLPVLSAASGGEIRIGDIVGRLAEQLGLTTDERTELLPSGKQTIFANRVHWAKTYLGKAGLIEITKRGYFKITTRGEQILSQRPGYIGNTFLNQFEEFRQFKEKSSRTLSEAEPERPVTAAISSATATPDEIMRTAYRQIQASLAQELLDRVRAAPPDFFERLIVDLLLSMGFGGSAADAGRALGRSGDDGVDGVIAQDALGLDRVYIQAKSPL